MVNREGTIMSNKRKYKFRVTQLNNAQTGSLEGKKGDKGKLVITVNKAGNLWRTKTSGKIFGQSNTFWNNREWIETDDTVNYPAPGTMCKCLVPTNFIDRGYILLWEIGADSYITRSVYGDDGYAPGGKYGGGDNS